MRCRLHQQITLGIVMLLGVTMFLPASDAVAQATYTKLQVLLPGETAAPGTGTGKVGVPESQTVGIPFTITVRACDANWNTVTAVTNVVQITSTDDTASLPPNTALTGGTAQLSVTMNAGGSFTVSAEDQSDPTIPLATSAFVTAQLLTSFEFNRVNQKNQYAGVPMAIIVNAVDPIGNTVTGYNGPVHLKQVTSFGDGRITPEIVTMSDGVWSGNVTMFRADETSINRGNVNIDAFLDSDPTIRGTSDPFTVHPGPFSRLQIVVPGQTPWPGSVTGLTGFPASQAAGQTFAVEVYATDTYWNPVPSGDVVRITSSDPAASTPVSGALDGNGFRQFTLSLGTVGTQTLTVNDQTNGSIQSMTSAGIPVGASAPHHFVIDPIPSPLDAGASVPVTIRATDVSGNTVPDFSGNAILSANTEAGSISPEAITFTNGVWTGTMVFRGAGGAVAFTCSDFASPPHLGTSNSFEVLPGPYAGLQVLLPGQTPQGGTSSGFIGTPTDQNAGSTFDLTIRAVDQYWNRVTGINNAISLTSSDPFAAIPPDTNLVNGELVFPTRLFKGGMQTITASDTTSGISSHTSSPVYILPGTYSRIVLIAPGETVAAGAPEGRSGTALDQSINFAFTVSVYATDQWFNPVNGVTDLIHITCGDPLAQLPPDTPMADGKCDLSIRLSTGGFQQITAQNVTQPTMPTSTTQVRAISSGLHLEAEVTPTAVQAGEPFDLTVKVVNDAGAVIQEVNSAVTVEVQNAATQEPGRGILENTQFQLLQGKRTMAETYTYAEDIVLVVRDDAGNVPAVTEVISVSPGAPAEIRFDPDPQWVRGYKHATIRATVVDLYDNGVPAQPVIFTLLSGPGTLTAIDSATAATGVATADFLSPREPAISRIRAVSNVLSAERDLETALVDPNSDAGTVTNYPNPFHPGEAPTTIAYKLRSDAEVTMRIFTLQGGLVLKRTYAPGTAGGLMGLNAVQWDGRNGDGEMVASGGYIVLIEANSNGETDHTMRRKIAVVR